MGRRRNDLLTKNSLSLTEMEPLTTSQVKVWESSKNLMLHGCAGTGKTFISCYLALDDLEKGDYKKITIIRSVVPTREMGFLPGTEKEKAQVYEQPYVSIFKELFGRGDDPYGQLKTKGIVDFITTSHIRGITLHDSVVIVDECQNMTFHELDSIITRMGRNCRLIFCGDFFQSDLRTNGSTTGTGINKFMDILKKMNEFDFVEFGVADIVRSDLVKSYLVTKYKEGI